MAGTKEGARKAALTNLARDPDFYKKAGSLGGQVKSPHKGFGYDDRTLLQKLLRKPTRAQIAAAKGGRISKRRKVTV